MSKEDLNVARHTISKSCIDDYIAYIDSILQDMEAVDRVGNSREVSKLCKLLVKKNKSNQTMPSKDLNVNPILSEKQLLD